jgi:DNA-binding response OmpR family regulator
VLVAEDDVRLAGVLSPGLVAEGDDYLRKPFSFVVLVARRRPIHGPAATPTLDFDDNPS